MDHDEFARRAEALRARLYRTAYLYLGSEADALRRWTRAYTRPCGLRQAASAGLFRDLAHPDRAERVPPGARRRRRLAGEEALPESAGPDAYDALPLKEAVRRLPEELQAVVILRYFAGYTQAETARALNIPQGTAATASGGHCSLLRLELERGGDA